MYASAAHYAYNKCPCTKSKTNELRAHGTERRDEWMVVKQIENLKWLRGKEKCKKKYIRTTHAHARARSHTHTHKQLERQIEATINL